MTKKRKLILGGGAGAVLLALLIVPALIDWSSLKPRITGPVETALGRAMAIDGRISVALLPRPRLSAHDVRLANLDGGSAPDMIRVRRLDLRLNPWALMTGRVEISSAVLIAPEIRIETLADGRANWTLGKPTASIPPASATPPVATTEGPVASGKLANPEKTAPWITRLLVRDGVLISQHPGQSAARINDLDVSLTVDSPQGPFHLEGRGKAQMGNAQSVPLAIEANLDRLDSAIPANISAILRLEGQTGDGSTGEAQLTGAVTTANGQPSAITGHLTGKAPDLSKLTANLGWTGVNLPLGGAELSGELSISAQEAALDKLRLSIAGQQASGGAVMNLGPGRQADLTLSMERLDLDALHFATPPPPHPATISPATTKPTDGKPTDTPPALSSALPPAPPMAQVEPPPAVFGLPKFLSLNVDLSAQTIAVNGGELSEGRINLALTNGDVVVNQASITLPGDADVTLFGMIGPEDGQAVFEGSFEATTKDLRKLLAWLKLDSAKIPENRLKAARLAGHVRATPAEIHLESTQLKVDDTRIDTAADLRLGERPALGISFSVDKLDLDGYRQPIPATVIAAGPALAPPQDAPSPETTARTAASTQRPPPALASRPSWLERVDTNVKGHVGQVTLQGLTAKDVAVDVTWLNGLLTLRDLSTADLTGSRIALSGALGGLAGGEPLRAQGLHYDVHGGQLLPLAHLLGLPLSDAVLNIDPSLLTGATFSGTVNGDLKALTIETHAEAGGGQINLGGKVEDLLTTPKADLTIEASHSSTSQMIRLMAPGYHPTGSLGAFAASTHVSGDLRTIHLADLRLRIGPASAAGDVQLTLGARPRLDATLSAGEFPIDPFLPGGKATPHVRDMINQGLLIPTNGVPQRHDLLPTAAAPPHKDKHPASEHSASAAEPAKPSAAPRPQVEITGLSDHWSRETVDLSWLKQWDAAIKLNARAVTYGQTRFEVPSLAATIANGVASLDQGEAQIYGGKLTANGKLDSAGTASLQTSLTHAQMRDALVGVAQLDIADGTLDAQSSLTSSGHSVLTWVEHLDGTGKIAIKDGAIKGFDLKAVDQQMANLNKPAGLLNLLQAGLSGGTTHFSSLNGTFHAAKGIVNTNDLTLTAEGGEARANGSINLPGYVMESRTDFKLASGSAAPPLSMRIFGPLDHLRQVVDINDIQNWLIQNGLAKLFKGKAPTEQAAGGTDSASTDATPKKIKAKDLLKGLLKGLR